MLRDFGSETLLAISDFQAQVIPFLANNTHGIVGSGATSIEARSSKFVTLAGKYESAYYLMIYNPENFLIHSRIASLLGLK